MIFTYIIGGVVILGLAYLIAYIIFDSILDFFGRPH